MLRFFRNIRRRLLELGSLRKYLVYAIGEILLVVIGILIALQVNTWNQQRINRINEKYYLNQMMSDLAADSLSLYGLKKRMEKADTLINTLVKELNTDDNQQEFNLALRNYINHVGGSFYVEHNSTYNEMMSTGTLGVIADPKLRNKILVLYSNLSLLKELLFQNNEFLMPIDRSLTADRGMAKFLETQKPVFSLYISEEAVYELKALKPELESDAANWYWAVKDVLPAIDAQLLELREMITEIDHYLKKGKNN
ncbi:MAG: hypothetical protein IPJ74_15130 [Saprospiraceae bacterium]|nr:hypothetical protein [Saprospiraceae bacterium]